MLEFNEETRIYWTFGHSAKKHPRLLSQFNDVLFLDSHRIIQYIIHNLHRAQVMLLHILMLILLQCGVQCSITREEDYVPGDILLAYVDMTILRSAGQYAVENLVVFETTISDRSLWPVNASIGYVAIGGYKWEDGTSILLDLLYRYPNVVAVVKFHSKSAVISASHLAQAIQVPIFTAANSMALDGIIEIGAATFTERVTSPRVTQLNGAIPSILEKLGVDVIGIVYTESSEAEFHELTKVLLQQQKVNIEFSIKYNDETIQRICEVILKTHRNRVRTFVYLGRSSKFPILIKKLFDRNNQTMLSNMLFIGDSNQCDASMDRQFIGHNFNFIKLCQTSFKDATVSQILDEYDLYPSGILSEPASNILEKWYERRGSCENTTCKTSSKLTEVSSEGGKMSKYNHRLHYTVKKILKSLENITVDYMQTIRDQTYEEVTLNGSNVGHEILKSFRKNMVDFPDNATFLNYNNSLMEADYEVIVVTNDVNYTKRTIWTSYDNMRGSDFEATMVQIRKKIEDSGLRFPCSVLCEPGSRTLQDVILQNCWECVKCTGNSVSEFGNSSMCAICPSHETFLWANHEKTRCDLAARSVNLETLSGRFLSGLAIVNTALLLFTVAVFVINWKNRVIISVGRDLSCLMFIAILLGHVEAFLIATEPNGRICDVIHVIAHVFMMLTAPPLLVKTFRIWFVFKFSVKFGKKVRDYVADWVTALELIVLIIPHMVLLLLGFLLDNSYNFRFTVNYEEEIESLEGHEHLSNDMEVTKSCGPGNFLLMLISIAYTGALLVTSTILGWDCRKLPDNFKESMHIFISSVVSLLLVVVYVPAMTIMAGFTQVRFHLFLTLLSQTINKTT